MTAACSRWGNGWKLLSAVQCCATITVSLQSGQSQLILHACNIPNVICAAPPEDEQVMHKTCRGSWFSINWIKSASRWFHYTDTEIMISKLGGRIGLEAIIIARGRNMCSLTQTAEHSATDLPSTPWACYCFLDIAASRGCQNQTSSLS
jgi:hypothetical protein